MEIKSTHMTDEYAARYFHKMGWMWARLEAMQYDKTWGVLTAKLNEKELRQNIAQEIESRICKEEHTSESDKNDCWWLENGMKKAAQIARGNE